MANDVNDALAGTPIAKSDPKNITAFGFVRCTARPFQYADPKELAMIGLGLGSVDVTALRIDLIAR